MWKGNGTNRGGDSKRVQLYTLRVFVLRLYMRIEKPTDIERFVIKIELPRQFTQGNLEAVNHYLVYTQDHKIHYEGEVTRDILQALLQKDGKVGKCKYFWAWIKGTELITEEEATGQVW